MKKSFKSFCFILIISGIFISNTSLTAPKSNLKIESKQKLSWCPLVWSVSSTHQLSWFSIENDNLEEVNNTNFTNWSGSTYDLYGNSTSITIVFAPNNPAGTLTVSDHSLQIYSTSVPANTTTTYMINQARFCGANYTVTFN